MICLYQADNNDDDDDVQHYYWAHMLTLGSCLHSLMYGFSSVCTESMGGDRVHARFATSVFIDVLMQKCAAITYISACSWVRRESRSAFCVSSRLLLAFLDSGLCFTLHPGSFTSNTVLMIIKMWNLNTNHLKWFHRTGYLTKKNYRWVHGILVLIVADI